MHNSPRPNGDDKVRIDDDRVIVRVAGSLVLHGVRRLARGVDDEDDRLG